MPFWRRASILEHLEAITHSARAGDARLAEFLPQIVDVDLYNIGAGIVVVAPIVGEHLLFAEHLPRMSEQLLRERELTRG